MLRLSRFAYLTNSTVFWCTEVWTDLDQNPWLNQMRIDFMLWKKNENKFLTCQDIGGFVPMSIDLNYSEMEQAWKEFKIIVGFHL